MVGYKQLAAPATNETAPAAKPLIPFNFGQHYLQLPCLGVTAMTPNIMDAVG